MILLANFLSAIAAILGAIFGFYKLVILVSVIMSWANADPYNGFVRAVHAMTDPVYAAIRRYIPTRLGGLDLSPLIVLLAVLFLDQFLVQSLAQYAARMNMKAMVG